MQQPLDGRTETGTGRAQIRTGFLRKLLKCHRFFARIMQEIQKYPPSFQNRFLIYQKVNHGRATVYPVGIKGPLIALQKGQILHLPGICKIVHQKFPFVLPFRVCGDKTGERLHIGSAHIPAGLSGSHSKLPFRQILSPDSGFKGDSAASKLRDRIDAVPVHACRASGGKHQIFTPDDRKFTACSFTTVQPFPVQTENSAHLFILYENLYHLPVIQNRNPPALRFLLQAFRHDF